MRNTIIDAGPLIALFNKDDKFHDDIIEFLRNYKGKLYTTWSVITEVMHMLSSNYRCQLNFLEFIELGGLEIIALKKSSISRLIELFKQYYDVPVDLADATLIILSEKKDIYNIITIDSDFHIYRNKDNKYIRNIFQKRWQK